jgi:adhesin/invasin
VSLFAGANQTGFTGTTTATAPAVIVRDANGNPVPGVTVFFGIVGGGGSVQNQLAVTDAQGVASAGFWLLGQQPGTNTLSAVVQAPNVSGNPVRFVANAVTAPVGLTVSVVDGDNQTAQLGTNVPIRPVVIVRDADGNPVAGVTVNFSIVGGGGGLSGATQTTDANGIARVGSWQLGAIGPNTLRATIPGGASVDFTATGT